MVRMLLLGLCVALAGCASTSEPPPAVAVAAPEPQALAVFGRVIPLRQATLSFQVDGQVVAWLVEPGEQVATGQALARLDDRALALEVAQAESRLLQAQTTLETLQAGATEEQRASAAANLDAAEARAAATAGRVSQADIAAAESHLAAAQARVDQLNAGPLPDLLQAAVSRHEQADTALAAAQSQLRSTSTDASAAKTQAEAALAAAANRVRQAQDDYSAAYWNNERAQTGRDPHSGASLDALGRERYAAALRATERELQDRERELGDAQRAYEQARQSEIEQLERARAQVATAQAELDAAAAALSQLLAGPRADELKAALADVAAARADLTNLRGAGYQGDVAEAQASVAAAQAELAALERGALPDTLARAQFELESARNDLALARLHVEQSILSAPFAGVVGQHLAEIGEQVVVGQGVLTIGDTSSWQIETNQLSELEVGHLAVGQTFELNVDAMPEERFQVRLVRIEPEPTIERGETTYRIIFDLLEWSDHALYWGMSTRVMIPVDVTP